MLRPRTIQPAAAAFRRQQQRRRPLAWKTQQVSTEAAAAAPVDEPDAPPPIVWTTHRLSSDQKFKVDQIFHKLLWLDMFEINMVHNEINRRLGIVLSPKQRNAISRQLQVRAHQMSGGGAAADGGQAEEAEADAGPQLFDLKLAGFDAKSKIKVIKEVRSIAGLGLKEAKELVESAPSFIQKGLKDEQAQELKAKLEEIGAQIELV